MKTDIIYNEIPKSCYECQYMSDDMYCKKYSNIVKGRKLCVENDVLYGTRNIGCPLKRIINWKKEVDEMLRGKI